MKAIVCFLVSFIILTIGGILMVQKKAECFGCTADTCYNSYSCGYKCSCVKIGTNVEGFCVSVDDF